MERFLCFLWLMMQRFIPFSFKMLVGSYVYYIFLLNVPTDLCMVLLCERKMLIPASKTSLKLSDCGLFD